MAKLACGPFNGTRPAGPARHPTRYDGKDGVEARRAIVLVLAARSLVRSGIGRTGRTLEALHTASVPIAAALEWPDAVFGRQHVARSGRIELLYHRIRFGPAHARGKDVNASDSAVANLKAKLSLERDLRSKAEANCSDLAARMKAMRHGDAIAQVKLFADRFGLTLGAAPPPQ